ncbi:hypothetical protein [uncultured Roseobacter sp.]|uniref:hypothetical protein n=1 Tax=uncultured Roseobacter sp. TaxID=114847 RepID=UPI002619B470|nr:hypothetical protein [uncultured Roseobacter sp.]
MLIFLAERLAFLATPKTGSTAVEMALRSRADVIFARSRKHIPAQRYDARVAPFVEATFGVRPESCAVMREPVEQLRSWYRYRRRDEKDGTPQSTKNLSFDDFVLAALRDDPPEFARVGRQFSFLCNSRGKCMVDHLFAYEAPAGFLDFLGARFGEIPVLERRNVSPDVPAELSAQVAARLRAGRADDFALYERLQKAGGYLSRDRHPATT